MAPPLLTPTAPASWAESAPCENMAEEERDGAALAGRDEIKSGGEEGSKP